MMRLEEYGLTEEFSRMITDYIEEVRELLSSDLWENIFLNCSKNEVFIFWLLYQKSEVNMTEIADYIHVPLNTATGIISRMERNGLVVRTRSEEDKRVVNIGFSEKGMEQFEALIRELVSYGLKVMGSFTKEEMELFYKMTSKIMEILRQENGKEKTPRKVRKIIIE
ncbi:MAG: MarR family transcriptional regulator [Lachnospiraceae bacterium]|nr:MarR family transcriptional regulator [Lachnospiraceae bacterium]